MVACHLLPHDMDRFFFSSKGARACYALIIEDGAAVQVQRIVYSQHVLDRVGMARLTTRWNLDHIDCDLPEI